MQPHRNQKIPTTLRKIEKPILPNGNSNSTMYDIRDKPRKERSKEGVEIFINIPGLENDIAVALVDTGTTQSLVSHDLLKRLTRSRYKIYQGKPTLWSTQ